MLFTVLNVFPSLNQRPFILAVWRILGSARFAVVLLILFALAMLTGTMLEVLRGVRVARESVFLAPWFAGLMGLINVSLLVSLLDRLPFRRRLMGFYIVHVSLILVFVGTTISSVWGVTGVMILRPDQPQNIVQIDGLIRPLVLPFALELESFTIDYEPNSKKEAGYRSRIKLQPKGEMRDIEMNRPLDHAGFSFYQTSHFKTGDGREGSLLSVNKDPGRGPKYLGCLLFVIGFTIHLRIYRKTGAA